MRRNRTCRGRSSDRSLRPAVPGDPCEENVGPGVRTTRRRRKSTSGPGGHRRHRSPSMRSTTSPRPTDRGRRRRRGLAVFGTLVSTAQADIYSSYTSDAMHGYIVENMPDFDQRRPSSPTPATATAARRRPRTSWDTSRPMVFPTSNRGRPSELGGRARLHRPVGLLLDLGTGITSPGPRPNPCGTGIQDLRELLSDRVTYRFIVGGLQPERSGRRTWFEDLSRRLAAGQRRRHLPRRGVSGTPSDFWSIQWPGGDVAEHWEPTGGQPRFVVTVRRIGLRNPWTGDRSSNCPRSRRDSSTSIPRPSGSPAETSRSTSSTIPTSSTTTTTTTRRRPRSVRSSTTTTTRPPPSSRAHLRVRGVRHPHPAMVPHLGRVLRRGRTLPALPSSTPSAATSSTTPIIRNVVIGQSAPSSPRAGRAVPHDSRRRRRPAMALPPNTPVTGHRLRRRRSTACRSTGSSPSIRPRRDPRHRVAAGGGTSIAVSSASSTCSCPRWTHRRVRSADRRGRRRFQLQRRDRRRRLADRHAAQRHLHAADRRRPQPHADHPAGFARLVPSSSANGRR